MRDESVEAEREIRALLGRARRVRYGWLSAILFLAIGMAWLLASCGSISASSPYAKAELAIKLAQCVEGALTEHATQTVTQPAALELHPYDADAGAPQP